MKKKYWKGAIKVKESIEEDIKILTDYMLELNADIQRAEEWANTGADRATKRKWRIKSRFAWNDYKQRT